MPGGVSAVIAQKVAAAAAQKKAKEEAAAAAAAAAATANNHANTAASNSFTTADVLSRSAHGQGSGSKSNLVPSKGILATADTTYPYIATGSAVLAKRIAERKAAAEAAKKEEQERKRQENLAAFNKATGFDTTEGSENVFTEKQKEEQTAETYQKIQAGETNTDANTNQNDNADDNSDDEINMLAPKTGGYFSNEDRQLFVDYVSTLSLDEQLKYTEALVYYDGVTNQSYDLVADVLQSADPEQQAELMNVIINGAGSSSDNPSEKAQALLKTLSPETQAKVIQAQVGDISQALLVSIYNTALASNADGSSNKTVDNTSSSNTYTNNGIKKQQNEAQQEENSALEKYAKEHLFAEGTHGGIKQEANRAAADEYGRVESFSDLVEKTKLMGQSFWDGLTKGTLNSMIQASHYLDAMYKLGGGDEDASGNIHKQVYAATKRNNEANDVGNPLDDYQEWYQQDAAAFKEKTDAEGITAATDFAGGLGQSVALLPAFAIPGLGEAAVYFQVAGERYDEAIAEGATEEQAVLSASIDAFPSALIERFGGGERIVAMLAKGIGAKGIFKTIASSAISEGIENATQEIVSSGTKSVYKDVPLYSNTEGKDAWINPQNLKESFVTGALSGAILGGGTSVVYNGLNAAISRSSTQPLNDIETATRQNLSAGKITEETANQLLEETSLAKAIYDVAQSESAVAAQNKIDGYVDDGTFTRQQGESLWEVVSANASKDDDGLPTSTTIKYVVGDEIKYLDSDENTQTATIERVLKDDGGETVYIFTKENGEIGIVPAKDVIEGGSGLLNNLDENNETVYNGSKSDEGALKNEYEPIPGQLGDINGRTANNLDRAESGYGVLQRPIVSETNQSIESAGSKRQGNSGRSALLLNNSIREKMNSRNIPDARLLPTSDTGVFSRALEEAKLSRKVGGMVDSKTPEELANDVIFLSENKMAGVAVEPSGNITAIFSHRNNKIKGVVKDLVITARENGGTHLDCYASYNKNGDYAANNLVNKYADAGMVPVAWMEFNDKSFKIPDGNPYGKPDVVFMARTADSAEQIAEKTGTNKIWTAEEVHALTEVADYEAGQQYAATIGKKNAAIAEQTVGAVSELESRWDSLKNKYGTWARGQSPQQISDKQVVSKFVDNFLENVEDPTIREELKQRVLNGELTHELYTDKQAQQDVANDISVLGEDTVNAQIQQDAGFINNIKVKKVITGQIESLVDAVNKGDASSALQMAQILAETGTNLGQGIQAYSQLKKLTPTGRLLFAQQELNADYSKKFGYAPEAIKADIEQNVNGELPQITKESVDVIPNQVVANIIRRGIQDGQIDLSNEIKKGNLKEVSLKLTRYAAESQNLDEASIIDVYGSIWEELNSRVIAYRESVIKGMLKTAGKNKKRNYLEKLLEYNNIGAFDDPDQAALILNKMDLPFLTQEDFQFITETTERARQLSEDSREQKIEYGKIDKLIASKKKYTIGQKIRTYHFTSMLLSMRTMERNVIPNVAMIAPNTVGDVFGTVLDKQIAKRTGQRTTGLPPNPIAAAKDAKEGVLNVFRDTRDNIDTSLAGNRDNVPMGDVFSNKTIPGKVMNKASKSVTIGLQLGDRPFEEAYYNNALRRQMQANKVSEPTELMKDIAKIVAIQRTWKDENHVTNAFQYIQNALNGGKNFGFGNILVPFVKTPANLLKAIYNYSPASAVSIVADISKFRKADPGSEEQIMAQFNLVNHTSKAIGGTVLMATAYALAESGLATLTGAGDDNDDREKYNEEVLGWQPYSLKIGDKYFSYAWIQPVATMVGAGVNLYENMQDPEFADQNILSKFADIFEETFTMSGEMIYEQTVLQGIYTLFGEDNPWAGVIQVATNAPQQFIPALIGQLAAAVDPYKRQTYISDDFIGNIERGILNKIPFASKTLAAKTNAMGEELERFPGNTGTDFLNSFFNPAQMSQIKETDVTAEISRLEETTNEKLYPNSMDSTIEVGSETITLTAEEKQDWNASVGGDFNDAVDKLMQSAVYQTMTDDQKASAISKIHEDINAIYKNQFLTDKGYDISLDAEYVKVKNAEDLGISVSDYVAIRTSLNAIDDDGEDNATARKRDYILNYGLDDDQTVYMLDNTVFANSDSLKNQAAALLSEYGIPILATYKTYSNYQKIVSTSNTRTAISNMSTYISENLQELSEEQRKVLEDTIVNVLDPYGYFEQIQVDFSGDVEEDKTTALSTTMKKYLDDALASGLTEDEFIYAYSFFSNVKNDAPAKSFAAEIDNLDLTAEQKSILLKARYINIDYDFHDGGDIEIKGYTFGDDTDSSASIQSDSSLDGTFLSDYVPPSSRSSGVPDVNYIGDSNGKQMTVVAGNYDVTLNPITSTSGAYNAEFTTSEGSAVVSPLSGTVKSVKRNSEIGGLTITVEYSDGTTGTYIGLADTNVETDEEVSPGDRIGTTGTSMTFLYRDETGTLINPQDTFNIEQGSGSIESTSDYYPTQTAKSYDNYSGSSSSGYSGYSNYSSWGGSSVLASLIGKKHGSYSRYSYGGWPTFSYTGNENKS